MPGLESAIFSARLPSGAWAGKWRSQVQLGNENRPYDTSQEPGLPIRATHRVAPTGTGRGEGGHIGPPPPAQAKPAATRKTTGGRTRGSSPTDGNGVPCPDDLAAGG